VRHVLQHAWGRGVGGWGLGVGGWGMGFGVWGLGFGLRVLVFEVCGLWFGVWGLGFGVWGLGFRVCNLEDDANAWEERSASAHDGGSQRHAARLPHSQHCQLNRVFVGVSQGCSEIVEKRGNFAESQGCSFVLSQLPHRHNSRPFHERLSA